MNSKIIPSEINSFQAKDRLFKYSFLSVEHLTELQRDYDEVEDAGKISKNELFRSYIKTKKFVLPEDFPNAKYIVVLAFRVFPSLVDFNYQNKKHEITISPGYVNFQYFTNEDLLEIVEKEIIKESGYRIEPTTNNFHMKLIVTRSGLGRYGRNNLCYIDGMGSFIALRAYFTDYDFQQDNFHEKQLHDNCENCRLCINKCPTQAFSKENFVVDIEKCITLYNENLGGFPDWMNSKHHNALFGCMRCQMYCPMNKEVMKDFVRLDEITEEETAVIMEEKTESDLLDSLSKKLQLAIAKYPTHYLPLLKQNLSVLFE